MLGTRWRWWLILPVVVWVAFALYFWIAKGVTEANARRITVGMMQEDVESILGRPNDLAAVWRKREAFWDAYSIFGCHYVAITVRYDAEGRVESTPVVHTFWSRPWDVARAKLKRLEKL